MQWFLGRHSMCTGKLQATHAQNNTHEGSSEQRAEHPFAPLDPTKFFLQGSVMTKNPDCNNTAGTVPDAVKRDMWYSMACFGQRKACSCLRIGVRGISSPMLDRKQCRLSLWTAYLGTLNNKHCLAPFGSQSRLCQMHLFLT